ncbi:isopenicillin N synthase family oxygenase [Leptolyngbya sp. FACHB-16]|uniref:isopenicillin N synthase family oxygenase n=1 Tax=unclassified Leptolyngbya TaxID=2650499 RepID=UPI0016853869|nr:isopenicillin N synthase family oxygenase [Leptolyngbya sp. FACHB-16]MBD2157398.1 isopenicillin N synthase family oxygenase [Leptolyngbya sp. FACHB-16]
METLTCIPTLPDPTVDKVEFAQQLHKALAAVGSAYIPVSSVLEEKSLLNKLKTLFELSELQKRTLAQRLMSPWQGVFLPLGEEQLADQQEDYKEVLDLNLEKGTYARWVKRRKAQQSQHVAVNEVDVNALMQEAQPLYEIFEMFQTQANYVLAALEMAYAQPEGSLVGKHGKNSTLRLLHYPPAAHLAPGAIRLGAHQDYSGITLLWQDATGGLEILTPANEWVAVNIPPGCIGVIVGEVMQYWSDGTLHSAPHRVRVANTQQLQNARYSIAFFCETNSDCIVYPGSLRRLADAYPLTHPADEPIVVEQFLTHKYDQIMEKVNF